MNIKYQDDIDNYILNRMSKFERLKFRMLYLWRSEICEQLKFTKEIVLSCENYNKKLSQIKEWEEEGEKEKLQAAACADTRVSIINQMNSLEKEINKSEQVISEYDNQIEERMQEVHELEKHMSQTNNVIYQLKNKKNEEMNKIETYMKEIERLKDRLKNV